MTDEQLDTTDPWMTLAEIAEELRVNPATVRLWVSKGRLKASRAGVRKWIVRRSDLASMLADTNSSADDVLARVERGEPAQLGASPPRRPVPEQSAAPEPVPHFEAPKVTKQSAVKLLQIASDSLDYALSVSAFAPPSPGYLDRIRAIADASEHIASTVGHAATAAGLRWTGRGEFSADKLPYELRPGGNRPGTAELWTDFDAAVERVAIAMTGTEMTAVATSFREMGDALTHVADELGRDEQWQAASGER